MLLFHLFHRVCTTRTVVVQTHDETDVPNKPIILFVLDSNEDFYFMLLRAGLFARTIESFARIPYVKAQLPQWSQADQQAREGHQEHGKTANARRLRRSSREVLA